MLNKIIDHLRPWQHGILAIASLVGFNRVKARLDASYTASKHPVDYFTGQTTFNAAKVKGYYAEMIQEGTLGIYKTTQLIDFGFILAMMCLGLFLCTLVARMSRENSLGRRVGLFAGMSVIAGALCDAMENGWSFIMLANPIGFSDWLVYPYSAFASIKFVLLTLGMAGICLSLLLAVLERVLKRKNLGKVL